jgi:hypothetical protein
MRTGLKTKQKKTWKVKVTSNVTLTSTSVSEKVMPPTAEDKDLFYLERM